MVEVQAHESPKVRLRLTPTVSCDPGRDAGPEPGGPSSSTCGRGSRGGVCGQFCSAEKCASRRHLRSFWASPACGWPSENGAVLLGAPLLSVNQGLGINQGQAFSA